MKKLLTFLTLLTLFFGVGWAEEVTGEITFANLNLINGTQYLDPFDGGNFTVTFAGGDNDGKYYTTGSGIRVYGGGTMTIAAKSDNHSITKIILTFAGDSYKPTSDDVVNVGTYNKDTGIWTGSAGEVVFTRPTGSGHWRVQKITVLTSPSGSTPTTYSLTLPTGLTGGIVSATGADDLTAIPSGTSMTVTATPNSGYKLNWMKANGTEVTSPYTFSITENTNITAEFTEQSIPSCETQTATYIFNTDDGLAALGITKPNSGAGTDISGATYTVGEVSFTSTNGGTHTRVWNSSGTTDLRVYSGGGSFTLTVPSNCTITNVAINGSSVGAITPSIGNYSNGNWVGEAQEITFTATGTLRINTITVTYLESSSASDMYILGMVNGNGIQPNQGVKMNYSNGSYSANIWVIGNSDNNMGVPGTWFAFTTVLANDNDDGGWAYVNNNRYSPTPSNGLYYWLNRGANEGVLASEVPLTKQNNDNAFLIPSGLYTITLTPSTTTGKDWDFNLTTIKDLTPTITPEGGEVALNSTATIALLEDFNTFIASCNPVVYASGTTVNITAPVATLFVNDAAVQGTSSEYTFDTEGEVTINAKGALVASGTNYAEKPASETYNVSQVYNVTVADNITGGSVTASPKNNVRPGKTVYVTVLASNNYVLNTLIVDGTDVASQVVDGQYTFTMPAHDVAISATFTYTGTVGGETTYELITSETENPFEVGAKYLIVNESAQRALGGAANSAIQINITDSKTTISTDSEVAQFILGGSSSGWTFQNGNGYLKTTDDNNGISMDGTSSDTWTISFTSQGNAVITSGTFTTRQIRYYSAGPNFRTYKNGSSGNVVQLYKETTVTTAAPTFSIAGGSFLNEDYPNGLSVQLACATAGATIYYSTDGTTFTEYTGAIPVTTTTTIYAYAINNGVQSETVSATYRFTDYLVNDVVFSPVEGTYYGEQTCQMFSVTKGARIIYTYTTDGSEPADPNIDNVGSGSYVYSEEITMPVGSNYKFKAIAYIGREPSGTSSAEYTISATSEYSGASGNYLFSIAELNSHNVTESTNTTYYTMVNPVQVVWMSSYQNVYQNNQGADYYPEYCLVRDNTGYGMIYFGKQNQAHKNFTMFSIGDWIPGGYYGPISNFTYKPEGSDVYETADTHPELGDSKKTLNGSPYQRIYNWPSSPIQNTAVLPEYLTIPEILSSDPTNADNDYWGHYVHLRKNTVELIEKDTDGKWSGTITDANNENNDIVYYDKFYLQINENWSTDENDFKGKDRRTFDVYGFVSYFKGDYQISPFDFAWIDKPIIDKETATYYEPQTVTISSPDDETATLWYKTSDMEDFAKYIPGTTVITVNSTTTIETYATKQSQYNDELESLHETVTLSFEEIPVPVISPESQVLPIAEDSYVDATIAFESGATGAVIVYTTDGSDPKTSETAQTYTVGTTTLHFTTTTTVRAIAKVGSIYGPEAESKTYTFVKSNGIEYTLITDETQLNANGVYVIVSKEYNMALSNTQGATNRGGAGVAFKDNDKTIVYGNDYVAQFTLQSIDPSHSMWSFHTNNGKDAASTGYLYVSSAEDNTLVTESEQDTYGNHVAQVLIDETGTEHPATIMFSYESATDRYLRFWDRDNLFNTYRTVTNSPVYIYGVEATPLATIEKIGVITEGQNQYTIADQLIAVEYRVTADGVYLWCKDQGNVSINKTEIQEGQVDFMKSQGQQTGEWDQSNWVVLKLTANNALELATSAKGHYLEPATVTGHYVDNVNYMIEVNATSLSVGDAVTYTPNVYSPANFMLTNLNINEGLGGQTYGDTGENGTYYFFMNPKIQEVCKITFAEWYEDRQYFTVPYTSGFDGAFNLGGWQYNEYGDVADDLVDEQSYYFNAIVNRSSINAYGPKAIEHNTTPDGAFSVYPADLKASQIVTAINTVDFAGNGEVKSVKYVNVAGMVSDVPFQGVNIVVTEYTDGSRTTTKMLRK